MNWATVTVTDNTGKRYNLDVEAESTYDAAHLFLAKAKEHVIRDPLPIPSLESVFEVTVNGRVHKVPGTKLQRWIIKRRQEWKALQEQGRLLREYRFHLDAKRRELVRDRFLTLIDEIDGLLRTLAPTTDNAVLNKSVEGPEWTRLKESIDEATTLLGSNPKPPRWTDLHRHLSFAMMGDLVDLCQHDWPAVKARLRSSLYGEDDPVPVDVHDLSDIVAARPSGRVTSRLNWAGLTDEDFERLMFFLIADTLGYENPQWLQQTNAADRGRDLSVMRVETDLLAGVRRHRVIIQCKHWQSRSVGPREVSDVRSQMELWHPPRVDRLVIATTGRFTADAVSLVEQHNQADRALNINMWPDTHLEMLDNWARG